MGLDLQHFLSRYNFFWCLAASPPHPRPKEKPLENIVGKWENAGDQHFLLFTQFSE